MTQNGPEPAGATSQTTSSASFQALLEACRHTPDAEKAPGNKPQDHYQQVLPPWRYKIRSMLLPLIHWETPRLAALQQRIRSEILDVYFALSANLGTHTFYLIMLPVSFWYGMTSVARDLLSVLAFGVYISGVLKDLLCLPRPLSPPLHRITMSRGVALEYGFPSTHSTHAAGVGLLMASTIQRHAAGMNWGLLIILHFLNFLLVFSIVGGRLYCGMHGFLDVFTGGAVGVALASVRLLWGPNIDMAVTYPGFYPPLLIFLMVVILVRIHPEPADECPCFDDGVSFMGVILGGWISMWNVANNGPNTPECRGCVPFDFHDTGIIGCIARLAIGVTLVVLWKTYSKKILLKMLPPIFRVIEHLGLDQPRKGFTPASQYGKVKGTVPDLTILETPHMSEIFSHSGRVRSDSVGPQSAVDVYESRAYEEYRRRRRESLKLHKDQAPDGDDDGTEQTQGPPSRVAVTVPIPRVKYDVEVVTRLIVYSGIGFVTIDVCSRLFPALGI